MFVTLRYHYCISKKKKLFSINKYKQLHLLLRSGILIEKENDLIYEFAIDISYVINSSTYYNANANTNFQKYTASLWTYVIVPCIK